MGSTAPGRPSASRRLRVALTGCGNRTLPKDPERSSWLGWAQQLRQHPGFELVAAHDVAPESLERVVQRGLLTRAGCHGDLGQMLGSSRPDVVVVTTPAQAHAGAIEAALRAGVSVLVEKPVVDSLADGRRLEALRRERGLTVAVSQNWRSKDVGLALRREVADGRIGTVGQVFFRYLRDREGRHLPPYIFKEPHPLLYAMGIHHLDLLRHVLADEFAWVSGQGFRPPWSSYESTTGVQLFLQTRRGTAVCYTGTFSSPAGAFPQECLVMEGDKGTLVCESAWMEPPLWFVGKGGQPREDLTGAVTARSMREQYDRSDAFIIEDLHRSLTEGRPPLCSMDDALGSVATVEACRKACETGRRVDLSDLEEGTTCPA